MRDYGVVSPKFWIGETGKKLRGDLPAQVLATYLMTSPHSTMTGVYHCPVLYMGHETGLGEEGASKALARLIQEGFCEYDTASEYVFVVNMAFWQIAESLKPDDRRVIGVRRDVEKMHSAFKSRFFQVYAAAFHLTEPSKKTSPLEAPSNPLPSQDQDQDQDQDQEQESEGAPAPPTRAPKSKSGTRIPEDFTLTAERRLVAEAETLPAERTFAKFRDYWSSVTGAKARKLDWDATWRNWCRSEHDRSSAVNGHARSAPSEQRLPVRRFGQ